MGGIDDYKSYEIQESIQKDRAMNTRKPENISL